MTIRRIVAFVLGVGFVFAMALVTGIGDSPPVLPVPRVEISTPLRTAVLTVLLGVIVFVVGQIAQRFFIEPIQEQRTIRKVIAHVLLSYPTTGILKKEKRQRETVRTLRGLSGQLRATLWTVPYYRFFESLGAVENKENVQSASRELAGWALAVITDDDPSASRHRSAISKALNLPQD